MSKQDVETAALQPSFRPKWRRRNLLIALGLAALATGAFHEGVRSRAASAATVAILPSQPTALEVQESQRSHPANADADIGPGDAEPLLVEAE